MGFFNNIGKTISDASQGVLQKGKEIADVAKLNSLIADEEKKITSIYEQIGRRYAEEFSESPGDSFAEYLEALKASEEKISEYQQKLTELKGITKCPTCGAEVPNGSLFCNACGTKIIAAAPTAPEGVCCSGCGEVIPMGSKFCTSCGKPVEAPAVENVAIQEEKDEN